MDFKQQVEIYLEENSEKYARVVIEVTPDGIYNIVHTYVSEKHRGEGLAASLVKEAVSYIKSQDGHIAADCSYARHYLEKNDISFVNSENNPFCNLKYMKEESNS